MRLPTVSALEWALGIEICTDPSHSREGRAGRGGEEVSDFFPRLLPKTCCSQTRKEPNEGCRYKGGSTTAIVVHLEPPSVCKESGPDVGDGR